MIHASCHCGAITLELPQAPTQLTSCNCSICRRTATLMAYYRPADVRILSDATDEYIWGDKSMALHRCKTCGCITHWTSLDPAQQERMGVNARMLDPEVIKSVRIRRFDGADTWTFLD